MELSKREKKLAREIIDRGIQKEFAEALSQSEDILKQWRAGAVDSGDAYGKLYQHIKDYDKRIAFLHDRITGSTYLNIIAIQIRDGFATRDDIAGFSDEARGYLQRWLAVGDG